MNSFEVKEQLEVINLKLVKIEEMLKFLVEINSRRQRPLTERQKQVLELKKQGLTDQQVSEKLGISRSYVTNIVRVLRKKGFEI